MLHPGPLSPAVLVLTFMRHVGGGLLDLTNERAGADRGVAQPDTAIQRLLLVMQIRCGGQLPCLQLFHYCDSLTVYLTALLACRLSEKLHLNKKSRIYK